MSEVGVALDGGVLRLTIDREERRNALSPGVIEELAAALRAPGPAARVVVLTGAGERAFCAGADLAATAPGATELEKHEARGGYPALLEALRECPLPVVARVRGLCLAGGLGLMLGCDLAVCSEDAEFGLPEVGLGLWPFMVGALLARHTSPKRALDLMTTGRRVDARTAYDWGLVSRVAADLDAEVDALCGEIASRSPVPLRLGKAAWYATADLALEPSLDHLQARLTLLAGTRDAAEGVTAFFEKREPRWTGR